jgi:5-formyltetrahydrofolate cyclo-ligase
MKSSLRRQMKATLAAMPAEQAAQKSDLACRRLTAAPEFVRAHVVMLYMPIPGEVDCLPAATAGWQAGKTVLLPRIEPASHRLLAIRFQSLNDEFITGRFGIREPAGGDPWPIERIDLIIVPGLAFDRRGGRLGRGGGFYDRFLAQPTRRAPACGLAFAEQVLDELPRMEHDYPVDMLVSDREVLRFGPAGATAGRPREG